MDAKPGAVPWPALAAALVAFAACALLGDEFTVMLPLAIALIVSPFVRFRLGERIWSVWPLRLGAYALITWTNVDPVRLVSESLLNLPIARPFGELCAAELVLQCWRRRASAGPPGAVVVLLSALVFQMGCNATQTNALALLTPAYFCFVVLTLRALRDRGLGGTRQVPRSVAVWIALAAALLLGAASSEALWTYRRTLDRWISRLDNLITALPSRGGFSDTPTLYGPPPGQGGSLERVLRIDAPPPESHLRGMAFHTYLHGQWGPNLTQRGLAEIDPALLRPDAPGPRRRITRWTTEDPVLFLPLAAAGIAPQGPVRWDDGEGATLCADALTSESYEVVFPATDSAQGPLCVPLDDAARARCLALPDDLDPRVRDLAHGIADAAPDAARKIAAVLAHLLTHHRYSLARVPHEGDPVTDFLLNGKDGHCEYFASAAVILLRCVGVPARYVGGYFAHEPAAGGGTIVRRRDAHAWAECWVDGRGWTTVEATPGDGRPDVTASELTFLQRMKENLTDALEAAKAWCAALDLQTLARLAAGGALLALAGIAWSRRPRKPVVASTANYDAAAPTLAVLASRFERALRRAGAACPATRTWTEHLAGGPEAARRFAAAYDEARFGRPGDVAAVGRAAALLEQFEQSLAERKDR